MLERTRLDCRGTRENLKAPIGNDRRFLFADVKTALIRA